MKKTKGLAVCTVCVSKKEYAKGRRIENGKIEDVMIVGTIVLL